MAQQKSQTDMDELSCSVCLDFMKDPVTIPCGHSYCLNCIESYWGERYENHSCPQCRKIFVPKPALVKNTMSTDLTENLKATEAHDDPGDGSVPVTCDFCTGTKEEAVKSCLQCLVSYCQQHLQPHYQSPAFKSHKLVDISEKLKDNICSRHNEVIKIFCRTDQQCICYLCSMDEHKGHNTVSVAAEVAEKQRELRLSQQRLQQRIKEMEGGMKLLQQQLETINHTASEAMKSCEKIFSDTKQQIQSRQRSELNRVYRLQEKLEQEILKLRTKNDEMQKLSKMDDKHTQFLRTYTSLLDPSDASDSTTIDTEPRNYTEEGAVSEIKKKLLEILCEGRTRVSPTGTKVDDLLPQPEPKTREEFLKYSCALTLDTSTAHNGVIFKSHSSVSDSSHRKENRTVHPDSFTDWTQVLCRESLTGRCYWEVEWHGDEVFLAVAYKDIPREGRESAFGSSPMSWELRCFGGGYEFRHRNIRTPVSGPQSSTIGVYLDHGAGLLSFYSISDTMTLLHRVHGSFRQPVCPGLGLWDSYAEICEL